MFENHLSPRLRVSPAPMFSPTKIRFMSDTALSIKLLRHTMMIWSVFIFFCKLILFNQLCMMKAWSMKCAVCDVHGVTEINEELRAYNLPGHPITWEQRTAVDLSATITPIMLAGDMHSLPTQRFTTHRVKKSIAYFYCPNNCSDLTGIT